MKKTTQPKIALFLLCTLFLLSSSLLHAQSQSEAYALYILEYEVIALKHQEKYKIPASITLAQGILESAAGFSKLAMKANNHFGIKCGNDWTGATIKAHDDRQNECFRKYKTAKESFDDHSKFLATRTRYADLFKLNITDYKAWAYGLRNAGYATDPKYAQKLIKIIEDFDLHQYDIGKRADLKKMVSKKNKETYTWKAQKNGINLAGHTIYKNNGVKCIATLEGDTFESIANEFRIHTDKLLRYNDLSNIPKLNPNTIIYLRGKKNKAEKQYLTHTVKAGENLYRISQKYGIKLKSLYDKNQIPYDKGPKVGQILLLQ